MTVTDSTSAARTTSFSSLNDATTARAAKKALGSEDFMKLLAVQFQSQDPLKPMEDTAFIAQMAQFSSLEQSSSLVREMSLLSANAYLGRTVTVENTSGRQFTGEVTAIDRDKSGGLTLTIDGTSFPLSAVRRIEPASVPASTPAPADDSAPTA